MPIFPVYRSLWRLSRRSVRLGFALGNLLAQRQSGWRGGSWLRRTTIYPYIPPIMRAIKIASIVALVVLVFVSYLSSTS